MEKLYDDLIKQLIEIGRTEIIPSIPESEFSYLREGQWQRARYPEDCDNHSIEELKLLFKGIVLCEKHFEWVVGSVTNTAWVLRNIEARLDSDSDCDETKAYFETKELYEFGFANRGNPYSPTGSSTHSGCNTYEDFNEVVHQKAINISKHDALMFKQQKDSRRMKATIKEYKEQRAKEYAERKKENDNNISIIDHPSKHGKLTSIFTTKRKPITGLHTEYYSSFNPFITPIKQWDLNYKNGYLDGLCIQWYKNGNKRDETNWKKNKKHGLDRLWGENENVLQVRSWKNDELNGKYTQWYDNGQVKEYSNFTAGKVHGIMTQWYENGQKNIESHFKYGIEHGIKTQWYENGQKDIESHFKDGIEHGIRTQWNESGKIELEATFKDGECISGDC